MSTETGTGNGPDRLTEELERLQTDWDRQERAEPPALLDQAVINAARRDLAPARRGRRIRWISGFATAGIAVVALSLVWLQESPQAPLPAPVEPVAEEAPAAARQEKGKVLSTQANALKKQDMQAASEPAERRASESFQAAPAAAPVPEPEVARDPPARLRLAEESKEELAESADAAVSPLPPEQWLNQLLQLREQGELEELARQLQSFIEAYPDYPLPDTLRN